MSITAQLNECARVFRLANLAASAERAGGSRAAAAVTASGYVW